MRRTKFAEAFGKRTEIIAGHIHKHTGTSSTAWWSRWNPVGGVERVGALRDEIPQYLITTDGYGANGITFNGTGPVNLDANLGGNHCSGTGVVLASCP